MLVETNTQVETISGRYEKMLKIIKGIYDHTCVPYLDVMEFSDDVVKTEEININMSNITVIII